MITRDQLLSPDLPVRERQIAFEKFPQGFVPTKKNCMKLAETAKVGKLFRYTCRHSNVGYYAFSEDGRYGVKWSLWARAMLGPKGLHAWVREYSLLKSAHMRIARSNPWMSVVQDLTEEEIDLHYSRTKRVFDEVTRHAKAQAELFARCMALD